MLLTSLVMAVDSPPRTEAPIDPWLVGGIALGILLVLLVALLMFGKGREHS